MGKAHSENRINVNKILKNEVIKMITLILLGVSILYVWMFWQPQMSSDYSSSSQGCDGKHMPYTSSNEPALIAHGHLVISIGYSDLRKLKELSYMYKGTKTGTELYNIRRKKILDERRKVHDNISDLNKKRQLLKKLKEVSIEDIGTEKWNNISIYDLDTIVRNL